MRFRVKLQMTDFLKRFKLQYPIIQAPMAGASTIELASTVTRLGGLGSIPLGSFSENPEGIVKKMKEYEGLVGTDRSRVVNLNFFAHEEAKRDDKKEGEWIKKYQKIYKNGGLKWDESATEMKLLYPTFQSITSASDEVVQTLVDLKPEIVSFHFGIPHHSVVGALQDAGISVFISATDVEEFKLCYEAGVDGVILQSWEAGGHRGNFKANDVQDSKLGTEELVDSVLKYIIDSKIENPPYLIAAGGIHSSAQIKKYLDKGVAAVQLGTVWLPTTQCTISAKHLEYIQNPQGAGTLMSPSISGRNLRTIETPFLRELTETADVDEIPDYPLPYDSFKRLVSDAKETARNGEYSAFLAGSSYDKSWKGTRDAENVFKDLVSEL
ncbi:Nitronate monooxygenase [Cyberlindnera fabianii]|nr:Nitronate monooxygenase [Cyberlindnera fabianii]